MKVSKEQSAANRQALVEAASRLYRERGVAGVGLTEISKAAGFTNGGFYGRFASKEALAAEACTAAFGSALGKLNAQLAAHGGDLREHFSRYFSTAHRDAPGSGCAMATLVADAAREQGLLGASMSEGIASYLQALALHRPDGSTPEAPAAEDKARAIHLLSTMVGAMMLSRACAEAAPELSEEILDTARQALVRDVLGLDPDGEAGAPGEGRPAGA